MNRKEVLATLEAVKPAVAKNAIVPIFSCFCFDGKRVTAFNDTLAISANCKTGLEPFGVNSTTLLGLLNNSGAEDINLALKANELVIKADRSTFKLPYQGSDDFVFVEPPNEGWEGKVKISQDFLDGLSVCLTTVSDDESMGGLMGVCFDFEQGAEQLRLYASDGDAITRYSGPVTSKGLGAYMVPSSFCNAILSLVTEGVTGEIEINSDWAKATLNNGFIVYGRIIVPTEQVNFEKLIKDTLKGKVTYCKIPDDFSEALRRAEVVGAPESTPTLFEVTKQGLQLNTEANIGHVTDVVGLKGHVPVTALVNATSVLRALKVADSMAILENCTTYKKGDDFLQVLGNMG